MTTNRTELIVLGMHRSGTSCVTGAMTYAGAYAGEPEAMTGTSPQNPKGFFELQAMRKICDDILHSADADWWKISSLSLSRVPHDVVRSAVREAGKVGTELAEHGTWIIKEPRLCLVLPVLRRALKDPVAIHIYRNPLEVARSLRVRNGFSIMEGLALWEAYNRAAIEHSADLPCVRLGYDELLEDPVSTMGSLIGALQEMNVTGLHEPNPEALTEFVTRSLRHESVPESSVTEYLSDSQRALWSLLRSEGRIDVSTLPAPGEPFNDALTDLEGNMARIQALQKLQQGAEIAEAKATKELRRTVAQINSNVRAIRRLTSRQDEVATKERKKLEQANAKLTSERKTLKTELDQLKKEKGKADKERDKLARTAERLERNLDIRFKEIAVLSDLLLKSEEEV